MRARGAPLVRDFGKPMHAKKFGYDVTVRRRTYVRPYVLPPLYVSHCEMSHSTCGATRVFSAGSGMAYFFYKTNENFEEH